MDAYEVSVEDVRRTAQLARLQLSPEEEVFYQKHLQRIWASSVELFQVDTTQVKPMEGALIKETYTRADKPQAALNAADMRKNAPLFGEGGILVPKVIQR